MDHKASIPSSYREPFVVNLVAAFCLAVLIALGAYVNSTTILVGGTSSPGFHAIQVDSTSWNVGCTVLGTAVGLLLSWGFSSFDGLLTRKELQSPNGVLAMYLRPLSAMRGLHQLQRRRFPVTRSFLILASAISSLTSATTVAIFGIHTEHIIVTNPSASYTIDQLPEGGWVRDPDGISHPVIVGAQHSLLSSFLYRDSYLRSFQAKGLNDPSLGQGNYVPESGTIGSTIYPGLNSSGIGLNMTSYTQYSGPSSGFDLPTSYTFERLDAAVFGTVVDVACVDATASYNVTTTKYGDPETPDAILYTFVKNNVINATVLQDPNYNPGLCIGSVVTEQNSEPLHTFLFPGAYNIDTPFVSECIYGGNEILASISLLEGGSPLQVNGIVTQGSPLNATVKWDLSNMTDLYISQYSHGGPGGSLADGWVTSEFYIGGFGADRTSIAQTMSTILGELGQAYYSLLRQNVEVANLNPGPDKMPDNGSFVNMAVIVLRVGGSSAAWIIIYGLLLISAMLGVVVAAVQKRVLPWSPQNPVEILQKCLPMGAIIDDLTPLKYREQFEVAYGDGARELTQSKQTHALMDPQAQQTGYDGRG
jgi:hypothetical protein